MPENAVVITKLSLDMELKSLVMATEIMDSMPMDIKKSP